MPRKGLAKNPVYKTIHRIYMITSNGRMYLEVADCRYDKHKKDYVRTYEWTFDKRNAMQFDTDEEAREFAEGYFKNFSRWLVDEEELYDGAY